MEQFDFNTYITILILSLSFFLYLSYKIIKKSSRNDERYNDIDAHEHIEVMDPDTNQDTDLPSSSTIKFKKIGKKKALKLQRKEEKKKFREYQEETRKRNEEAEKQIAKEERKKKKELEKREMEEAKAWKEYQQKKEDEEGEIYRSWKSSIKIESEGSIEMEKKDIESKATEMVEYLKRKKVVAIEEILGAFQIKEEGQVVKILDQLIEKQNLFAFLDGNGKYVCISNEEVEKIKEFVKAKGRVSFNELGVFANRMIDWSEVN